MALRNGGAETGERTNSALDLGIARQRLGVSLEEIADRTKISMRFLRAIEAEEFDKLPGGIFTTSYLRQYASAVGVEESRLLNQYQRIVEAQQTAVDPPPAERSAVKATLVKFLRASMAAGR